MNLHFFRYPWGESGIADRCLKEETSAAFFSVTGHADAISNVVVVVVSVMEVAPGEAEEEERQEEEDRKRDD